MGLLAFGLRCAQAEANPAATGSVAEVHQFGAVGDGIHDDSVAIQKAVNSGRPVYLPSYYNGLAQRYRIARPINCTNRRGPTLFYGDQAGEFDRHGPHGSSVILQTGAQPAFDIAGSQDVEFRDISLIAEDPGASEIAVFEARSRDVPFAQNHRFFDLNIYMYSKPRANHGRGRIGIYDYGAELWSAAQLHIEADIPLYFTNENEAGVTSETALAQAPQSMSGVTIAGESSLIAYGGPAIYLGGSDIGMLDFGQTFIAENSAYKGTHSAFAIVAAGAVRGLRYYGNVENLHQLLSLSSGANGLDLSGTIAPEPEAPVIELDGSGKCPSISDSFIRLRPAVIGTRGVLIGSSFKRSCVLAGNLINQPAGMSLGVEASSAGGNLVYGAGAVQ